MFLIFDLETEFNKSCAYIFKICLRAKFLILSSDDSLAMTIKTIAKYIFWYHVFILQLTKYYFACGSVWVWNLVSDIKGGA
jgi:hypothetical protein